MLISWKCAQIQISFWVSTRHNSTHVGNTVGTSQWFQVSEKHISILIILISELHNQIFLPCSFSFFFSFLLEILFCWQTLYRGGFPARIIAAPSSMRESYVSICSHSKAVVGWGYNTRETTYHTLFPAHFAEIVGHTFNFLYPAWDIINRIENRYQARDSGKRYFFSARVKPREKKKTMEIAERALFHVRGAQEPPYRLF